MFKEVPDNLVLTTARCLLRALRESDIPHVFEATQYPGFNDGMQWDAPACEDDLLVAHQRNLAAWQDRQAYVFTAETLGEFEFVGRVSIRQLQHGIASIGYWIHPKLQGKGYGKEVAERIIRFGFEQLELEQIEASHALWNIKSRRIMEHAGMKFVSRIPEGLMKNGEWVAEDKLAITREEWLARHGNPERED